MDGDNANYFDPMEPSFPPGWETGWFPQNTWSGTKWEVGAPYQPYPPAAEGIELNVHRLSRHLFDSNAASDAHNTAPQSRNIYIYVYMYI